MKFIGITIFFFLCSIARAEKLESFVNQIEGCSEKCKLMNYFKEHKLGISLSNDRAKFIFSFEFNGEKQKRVLLTNLQSPYEPRIVVQGLNESVSQDVHIFAKIVSGHREQGDVEVTLRRISAAEVLHAETKKIPPAAALKTVELGARNFRGTYQELRVKNLYISEEYWDDSFRFQFDEWEPEFSVVFQDGMMKKRSGDGAQNKFYYDDNRSHCILEGKASDRDYHRGYLVQGIMTLNDIRVRTGYVSKPGEAEDYRYESVTAQSEPRPEKWIQYTKAKNGLHDNRKIFSLECTSDNGKPVTVETVQKAIPAKYLEIVYPRHNTVEVYLDYKYGYGDLLKGTPKE